MSDFVKIINQSKEIPENYKYYWSYMYNLAKTTVVPYLKEFGAFRPGFAVAEIGSAEGGVLAALVEEGGVDALGTDIALERLEMGRKISALGDVEIEFTGHNILSEDPDKKWEKHYDLVILRDVIEHLDDTNLALSQIKKLIKPGGYLFVTFPPYHSPFGGHQHTIGKKIGMLPYIHLLPNFIFHNLISSGRANDIEEVKRLQEIRLTPGKFMKAAKDTGYEIFKSDYYLIRPVFKMKFGLPEVKTTPISFLPLVKSLFSLEACYILKVK